MTRRPKRRLEANAKDYRKGHGAKPHVHADGSRWFKIVGEGA